MKAIHSNPTSFPMNSPDSLHAKALSKVLNLLSSHFSDEHRPVNGGDLTDEMAALYRDLVFTELPAIDSPLQAQVIYSASEDGYWSNEDGWGELSSATHFFGPIEGMPMASAMDARAVGLVGLIQAPVEDAGDRLPPNQTPK